MTKQKYLEYCADMYATAADYDNAKKIYVILESTDKCKDGDFEFEYN